MAKWEPISELKPKPGETFVDVGSNVGYYTLKLAKTIGRKGKIISIEPDPDSFEILRKNCELNNLETIELHNLAIGDPARVAAMRARLDVWDAEHAKRGGIVPGSDRAPSPNAEHRARLEALGYLEPSSGAED